VEQSVQGFSHNPQIGIDAELNYKLQKRLTGTCHSFGVENRRKSSHFLGDYFFLLSKKVSKAEFHADFKSVEKGF
jgi:hypothetical protein